MEIPTDPDSIDWEKVKKDAIQLMLERGKIKSVAEAEELDWDGIFARTYAKREKEYIEYTRHQQVREANNSALNSDVDEYELNTDKKTSKKGWRFVVSVISLVIIGVSLSVISLGVFTGGFTRMWSEIFTSLNIDEPVKVSGNSSSSSSSFSSKSEQTVFKVGDVIAYNGQEILVESVERNWTAEFFTPSAGKEYVKVNIQIGNKSDEKISYNMYDWGLQDSNGDIQRAAAPSFAADDYLSYGELASGGKKSGSLIFEVARDDTGLILHYDSSLWWDDSVEIHL
jgi:hypothetical protein